MPTRKQLHLNLQANSEFGLTALHGFGLEHADHIPAPRAFRESKGEIIGHIEWNEETDSIKFVSFKRPAFVAPKEMPVQARLPAPTIS